MTISQDLAEFSAALTLDRVPAVVQEKAAQHALDTLGCGIAAYALGQGNWAAEAALEEGSSGQANAIGQTGGLTSGDAAFINGVLSHTLDFDDTHPAAVAHVSASVTPAAIAAAQAAGTDGARALAAIVVGNEVAVRVGTVGAGYFHERGFHPTGIAGIFGCAAAAAHVRQLSAEQTAHAIGIAGSMAGGLLEFLSDGAQTKPVHPGWAARGGLIAAALAAHGATGPATVFEGSRGFYNTYLYGVDRDPRPYFSGLGERWETAGMAFKPYAACHYTHASVDSLADLMAEQSIDPTQVEEIVAYTNSTGVGLVLEPAEHKVSPRTPYDAKFSLPYCLSHMLLHGNVHVSAFTDERLGDPDLLELTPRVRYEERTYGSTPDSFGGGVRVVLKDGTVREKELRHQRGSREYPLTAEDVLAKYEGNTELGLEKASADRLAEGVLGMASQSDLSFLSVLGEASTAK